MKQFHNQFCKYDLSFNLIKLNLLIALNNMVINIMDHIALM